MEPGPPQSSADESSASIADRPSHTSADGGAQRAFEQASEGAELSLLAEFFLFLRENKKWWLVPLIGSLLLIGVVGLLAASGAAPWIYTLF
ncbi:MAG: hypothetical protein D6753_06255 [Planctomycetota bacterium]|nr:MAG: hypothetical protein D6753_06255 [Planctomycetota bacterium]